MKTVKTVLFTLLTLMLCACSGEKVNTLEAGRFDVMIKSDETELKGVLTLESTSAYSIEYNDPGSPLFGLKKTVSDDGCISEYNGIEYGSEYLSQRDALLLGSLNVMSLTKPSQRHADDKGDKTIVSVWETDGISIFLSSEKDSGKPTQLDLRDGETSVTIQFIDDKN